MEMDLNIMERPNMPSRQLEKYDLRNLIALLADRFAALADVYVFGSRRYVTGSPRSDIDLLVRTNGHIRPSDLRDFALAEGPALDLFLSQGGTATSCANESHVAAGSFDELVLKLDAIHLLGRDSWVPSCRGFQWSFQVPLGVDFEYTVFNSRQPFWMDMGVGPSRKGK